MRYWKRVDAEGNTTTVESYSHNLNIKGATEISKAEFDAYIASLPPPVPPRNFIAELDALKTRVGKLEAKSL